MKGILPEKGAVLNFSITFNEMKPIIGKLLPFYGNLMVMKLLKSANTERRRGRRQFERAEFHIDSSAAILLGWFAMQEINIGYNLCHAAPICAAMWQKLVWVSVWVVFGGQC